VQKTIGVKRAFLSNQNHSSASQRDLRTGLVPAFMCQILSCAELPLLRSREAGNLFAEQALKHKNKRDYEKVFF
jgi:hypothetical protein